MASSWVRAVQPRRCDITASTKAVDTASYPSINSNMDKTY